MTKRSCCDDVSSDAQTVPSSTPKFAIDSAKDMIQDEEDIPSDQQYQNQPSISKVTESLCRARDDTSRRRRPGEQAKCARTLAARTPRQRGVPEAVAVKRRQ